jgi:hypothetical protein
MLSVSEFRKKSVTNCQLEQLSELVDMGTNSFQQLFQDCSSVFLNPFN